MNRRKKAFKHYIISGDIQNNRDGVPIYHPRKADVIYDVYWADELKWEKTTK